MHTAMTSSSLRRPAPPFPPPAIARVVLAALVVLPGGAGGTAIRRNAAPAPVIASSQPSPHQPDTLVIVPGHPPGDFVIALEGGEGRAVPGDYYVLRIRIDRMGRGTFRVEPSLPGSQPVSGTFDVADSVVRQLHRASARLWNPRPVGHSPDPGAVNTADIVLTGYGQTVRVGEPLRDPWDEDVRTLSRHIRAVVPDSLWARAGRSSR